MECGINVKDDYEIVITQGDTLRYEFEIVNQNDEIVYGLQNLQLLCEGLNLKIGLDKWGMSLNKFTLYVTTPVTKTWDAGTYKYNLVCNYNSSYTQFFTLINGGVLVVLPQQNVGG